MRTVGSPNEDGPRGAIAGACAGAFSKTATAPIERVKLLLQLRESNKKGSGTPRYGNTVWEVTKEVYRREGFLAFWRGNTPSVLQKAGNAALNFMLMDYYKSTIALLMANLYSSQDESSSRSASTINSLLSAALSGGTTATVLYPFEYLRTRLAADLAGESASETRRYSGMRDVFLQTWRSDGIRGLYQGFGTSLWFVTLHRTVYLGGFDVLKTELIQMHKRTGKETTNLTMGERMLVAQFVSMLAGTVCYPLDTVRRRLMMQAGLAASERQYRNWWDCATKVWTQEGVRGFFRGLGPNLAKTYGGALLLVAYDSFRGVM